MIRDRDIFRAGQAYPALFFLSFFYGPIIRRCMGPQRRRAIPGWRYPRYAAAGRPCIHADLGEAVGAAATWDIGFLNTVFGAITEFFQGARLFEAEVYTVPDIGVFLPPTLHSPSATLLQWRIPNTSSCRNATSSAAAMPGIPAHSPPPPRAASSYGLPRYLRRGA